MFGWFKKREQQAINPITVDVHSHLLAGIDDGVKTLDEAVEILLQFQRMGYRKVITTPHVMSDAYRNSPETILSHLEKLRAYLQEKNIAIEVEAAAEYYLDTDFMSALQSGNRLLTFGQNYLLFETNFISEPLDLKQFIFLATTKGYKPVLAHPERYLYLYDNMAKLQDLLDRGVLFQLNISSITGYYSKQVQQLAFKLIDRGWVHLLGSDCHHLQQALLTEKAHEMRYYQKALSLPLLNNSL